MSAKPIPGDTVRLCSSLRDDSDPSTWRVVDCACELCAKGRHVALNEPSLAEGYPASPPKERPRWRHISYTSLEAVRPPESDELPVPPPTPRVPT